VEKRDVGIEKRRKKKWSQEKKKESYVLSSTMLGRVIIMHA
jgi:hypothetical protein